MDLVLTCTVNFGGIIAEPMADLVKVMSQLVDSAGNIFGSREVDTAAPLPTRKMPFIP